MNAKINIVSKVEINLVVFLSPSIFRNGSEDEKEKVASAYKELVARYCMILTRVLCIKNVSLKRNQKRMKKE